jgi:hypothetical protein
MESEAYRLAKADLMVWVSFAPNVQENGVSFDLLFSDRTLLREKANRVYGELGDEAFTQEAKSKFGYVGSRL